MSANTHLLFEQTDDISIFNDYQEINACIAYIEHLGDLRECNLKPKADCFSMLAEKVSEQRKNIARLMKKAVLEHEFTEAENMVIKRIFDIID